VIVDALAGSIPTPNAFAAGEATTLGRLRGYAEHFRSDVAPARTFGEVQRRVETEYEQAKERAPTEEQFFAMLDDADIGMAAVYTERYGSTLGVTSAPNEEVAEFVARDPARLIGLAGIDPWEPDAGREVDRAVQELGLAGVVISPFKQRTAPDSAVLARVFGRCEALGAPVFLHTGINWFLDVDYDVGHPRGVDRIARAFPDLTIVALHCGWPWVLDMMMVAWRHENVYLDISAHRPKHFTVAESGWTPLLYYGNRMLSGRVLFASAWTLLGIKPAELVSEVRALPLKNEVIEQWLGGNALKVFGRT
jgi:predicted TIM-barrel fold metal-dependent hydrolase